MKKIFYFLSVFLLLFITNVKALSVSKDTITIEKGKSTTVDIYGNYEEATSSDSFSFTYTTYDIIPSFNVNSKLTLDYNNQVYNIIFPESKTGEVRLGTLDIKIREDATATFGRININGTIININIIEPTLDNTTTEETSMPTDKNLLKLIKSNFVSIDLKDNVFEYDVSVDDDIEKLDLKPIAYSSSAIITVSTQVIKDLPDNKITINVVDNNISSDYIINVKQVKREKQKLNYDKETFDDNKMLGVTIIVGSIILMLVGVIVTIKNR